MVFDSDSVGLARRRRRRPSHGLLSTWLVCHDGSLSDTARGRRVSFILNSPASFTGPASQQSVSCYLLSRAPWPCDGPCRQRGDVKPGCKAWRIVFDVKPGELFRKTFRRKITCVARMGRATVFYKIPETRAEGVARSAIDFVHNWRPNWAYSGSNFQF